MIVFNQINVLSLNNIQPYVLNMVLKELSSLKPSRSWKEIKEKKYWNVLFNLKFKWPLYSTPYLVSNKGVCVELPAINI